MISVHYEMPKSTYTHKSMLLRGIIFGKPALDRADIEATKGRANHSGRSHGGAPLRGGRGRGGQMNYSDSRPNPFAAHINPGYPPPGALGTSRGGPVPPPMLGWVPPPKGQEAFSRGPPPPPGHGYNYGPPQPPQADYYGGQSQQPQHGYYMSGYGNHAPDNNYYRPPPPGDRYGGSSNRNGR